MTDRQRMFARQAAVKPDKVIRPKTKKKIPERNQ